MDPLTSTAAAGMRSRLEALDLLANNLANSSTPGFKADREAYNLYLSEESRVAAANWGSLAQTTAPVIETHSTDFTQGLLITTGNPDDLALAGKGFFLADGPNGALLTRGGCVQVTKDGRLTTKEGYELATVEPRRIRADPALPVTIDSDGMVRQVDQPLGHLKLVDLAPGTQPAKREGVYFVLDTRDVSSLTASRAEVYQGRIEQSNYSPAEAAVKLVGVLRQFESLQRALQMGSEMGRKAVEEVARVSP